ncbi:MAG: signal peptidase II [Chloroflexota bacterium]
MKKYLKDYLVLFLLAGFIICIDQWTKLLVRQNIPLGGMWMPVEWLQPYARIVHWSNAGAAFGLFQNGSLIFAGLAVVVILVIIYYFPQVPAKDWTFRLALVMQLAGAAGNLVDRLMFAGKVTDFISIGNFAVFNIADASITIGVIVLLIGAWVKDLQEKKIGKIHVEGEKIPINESDEING